MSRGDPGVLTPSGPGMAVNPLRALGFHPLSVPTGPPCPS